MSIKLFFNTLNNTNMTNNSTDTSYYGDLTFKLKVPLQLTNIKKIWNLSIADMIVYIDWSMISAYLLNNIFYYSINGGIETTFTIPDGSYTSTDLKNYLTNNSAFTVTYSTITNKFTFVHSTYNFTLRFDENSAYEELGFKSGYSYTSTAKSLTSSYSIDLSGSRQLFVKTSILTKNIDPQTMSNCSYILDNVPINVDNYNLLSYTSTNYFRAEIIDKYISEIRIQLLDDEYNIIGIKSHWSITLQLDEVDNPSYVEIDLSKIKNNLIIDDNIN